MVTWPQLRALSPTLVTATVVTVLLCQRHAGFLVLFEALILAPWILASIWRMIRNPQQRSPHAAKLVIWLLSIGIVIGFHVHLTTQTRAKAQMLVDAVISHHKSHGTYPKDLQTIGYAKDEVRSMIGMGGYTLSTEGPFFFYASTYVPFGTDDYDFSAHQWVHFSD